MGGAIFVTEGGTLNVAGNFTVNGGTVAGGNAGGAGATAGSAYGSGIFLQGNGTLTFSPGAGTQQVISDAIADQTGSGGSGGYASGGPTCTVGVGCGSYSGAGSWALNKTGEGALVLSGTNTYTGDTSVNAGALVVNGSIVNSATTVHDGGTLMGTGQLGAVTVDSGGIHAPGNSIGTQTVNGPYILTAGAILEIEIAPGTNNSDRVIVNGTVDITGAILRVLAGGSAYALGTEYLIIENDGADSVTGTFASIGTNLVFLAPTVNYAGGDGNDVVLTLARNNAALVGVAETPNQVAVAGALNQLPQSNPLVDAILIQSAEGTRQAYDALSGEVHATLGSTLARDSRFTRDAIFSRLQQAHYAGGSSTGGSQSVALGNTGTTSVAGGFDAPMMGLGMESGKGSSAYDALPVVSPLVFWTQAFGSWGSQDSDGNAASADRTIGGFLSGVDTAIGNGWRTGLAVGYSRSNVSVPQRISSAEIDSYHFAGYAGGTVGAFALRTGASWSWNEIDTERTVVFPGFLDRVEANYDGDTGQIFGEIALPLSSGRLAHELFANLAYVHVSTDRFTEHGGLAALDGFGGDQDVGFSTLGIRFATQAMIGGAVVVPRASFAWQHAFGDVDPTAALAFSGSGATMSIGGVPLARNSALIEAGLDINLSPAARLGVSYNGEIASNVEDHGISGRLNWRF